MNDDELARLFQSGTAAERDQFFSGRMDLYLRHGRQISALLKGVRVCCVTMLVVGLFVLTQMYQAAFGTNATDVTSSMSSIAMPLIVAIICSVVAVLRKQVR